MKNTIKKLVYLLIIIFLTFLLGQFSGVKICKNYYGSFDNYDVNKDGIINVQDYIAIKKYIMKNN